MVFNALGSETVRQVRLSVKVAEMRNVRFLLKIDSSGGIGRNHFCLRFFTILSTLFCFTQKKTRRSELSEDASGGFALRRIDEYGGTVNKRVSLARTP